MWIRDERGQAATEYLGALLVVAVIVTALAFTSIGDRIEWHMQILVCRIAGGTDCSKTAGNPDAPTLAKCVVPSSDKSLEASLKVLVFKLEGGIAGTKRVSADGTSYVTLKANAGAGLEFSTPGVEAGDADVQASSPKGEFAITGKGEFARTWKFTSEGDADDFIDHMVDKVKARADLVPNFLQGADDYDPPDEDSNTVYGGLGVNASASAGGGGAYANVGGGVEAGFGVRYLANGDKTYFFK